MMCTVQVLLVPDVMRRTNGPVRADPPRNICRRLFSQDDRPPLASNSRFLNHLRKDLEKRDRERWNFDFRTEMPLPGRYNWVPVGPKAQTELSKDSVIKTEASSSTARKDDRPSPSLRRTSKISNIKKKVALQSKITDFLLQRKRHRTADSEITSPKLKSRRLEADSPKDFFYCRNPAT